MTTNDYNIVAEAIKKTRDQMKSATSDFALINFALNFCSIVQRSDNNFYTDDFLDHCSMGGEA